MEDDEVAAPLVSVIAQPLANEKLAKKVLKVVKKAAKRKSVRRGVKEVVKALRKSPKGCFCVIAGDISPVDVITHVPVLCEDAGVPYIYVPSKDALGAAGLTKRPTSVMLVLPEPLKPGAEADATFDEEYGKVLAKLKTQAPVFAR